MNIIYIDHLKRFINICCIILIITSPVFGNSNTIHVGENSITIVPRSESKEIQSWRQFLSRHPGNWFISRDGNGLLRYASVQNGEYCGQLNSQSLYHLLKSDTEIFGIDEIVLLSLVLVEHEKIPSGFRFIFQAQSGDFNIFQSHLIIRIGHDGRLMSISNKLLSRCHGQIDLEFDISAALTRLQDQSLGTIVSEPELIIYSHNNSCELVLQCYMAMPMPGYKNNVEMVCLVDRKGQVILKKPRFLPYRLDATD